MHDAVSPAPSSTPHTDSAVSAQPAAGPSSGICVEGVVKRYRSDVVIGPFDLEIKPGGLTSLIGPNGAGKSTLLTMIGRLLPFDEGRIEVAGMDVTRANSNRFARTLAILKQENHFVTRLTVRQLVGFGRFPYSKGRLTPEDEEIISRYIDFLQLGKLEDRYLDQLSGGQRQRAYVAMVLAQETDFVLLDEPLNNLDISHSVHMMRHLRRAADELGRTIVLVLHDINFASRYSDQIIALRDGVVCDSGTPEEIMSPCRLSNVFDADIDVVDTHRGRVAIY
ncbi:iron complex transport system ATP-binding protein [Actinobaculum suis]|uniref:ATP-binding cassette domain-containing protein n=1 Tax=Actinobaculum suis TaxID=1657 RepID=A0A1G7CZP1_9ACTO|nr:ATP-binding cassette domain-containing protein [Actinobaculum suis]MDY5152797.1 ATP-binding cassette domain-containing protein [Actinobaculum suis]SDE44739.1 iron complex transport system ATP-binding protein [Actinobaculum suis]VDG77273.1 iron compound ABC transporter, ATP-binding protein [Actinobaculum suis]